MISHQIQDAFNDQLNAETLFSLPVPFYVGLFRVDEP